MSQPARISPLLPRPYSVDVLGHLSSLILCWSNPPPTPPHSCPRTEPPSAATPSNIWGQEIVPGDEATTVFTSPLCREPSNFPARVDHPSPATGTGCSAVTILFPIIVPKIPQHPDSQNSLNTHNKLCRRFSYTHLTCLQTGSSTRLALNVVAVLGPDAKL